MAHVYKSTIYLPVSWHKTSFGSIPENAILAGYESNGERVYVARVSHGGDTIPGKLTFGQWHVSFGCQEHHYEHYQVLTSNFQENLSWIEASHGEVPNGAIVGGKQDDGTELFIGRAKHNGSTVAGKVHPKHGVLYHSFGEREHKVNRYEVLVVLKLIAN